MPPPASSVKCSQSTAVGQIADAVAAFKWGASSRPQTTRIKAPNRPKPVPRLLRLTRLTKRNMPAASRLKPFGVREPVTHSVLWRRASSGIVPMNTVVETRSGELRGTFANGVHSFKGVPYAAPPFGNRRFLPPQPVEATPRSSSISSRPFLLM